MRLFRLRNTDAIFEYDEMTRTITLRGVDMAYVEDAEHPGSWMLLPNQNSSVKLTIYPAGTNFDEEGYS